jgi:hypothetical protein
MNPATHTIPATTLPVVFPETNNELVYPGENIIQETLNYIDPTQAPDKEFGVLEAS